MKATRSFVSIRNSYLGAMLDEQNLAAGLRSDKLLDIASAAEVVIYNNELVGTFSKEQWGVPHGLIFLRARRGMWGADSPYPDISLDPPRSSVRLGFAPEGFTAGPETFVNPAFWEVVRSYDIADPANPYSFKKYVAYNRFRWLDDDNVRRQSVFRDDGRLLGLPDLLLAILSGAVVKLLVRAPGSAVLIALASVAVSAGTTV